MRLVSGSLIDLAIEMLVRFDVGRKVRCAELIDLTDDPALRRKALADEILCRVAERGDEHELVLFTRRHLVKRIIEKDRARLGWNKLECLFQDLAQHEIEIDFASERQAGLMSLEETFELRDLERMKVNHERMGIRRL